MRRSSLIAYDAAGVPMATLDSTVKDERGRVIGHRDFIGMEAAGVEFLRQGGQGVWKVERVTEDAAGVQTRTPAAGSKAWPEPIGTEVYEYRVELAGEPGARYIAALVPNDRRRKRLERRRVDSPQSDSEGAAVPSADSETAPH